MGLEGMYMLKSAEYTEEKIHEALKLSYTQKK